MDRKNVINIILCLIFVVVFNVIFFIAGGASGNASVWIGYAFIHISYILRLVTIFLLTDKNSPELSVPLHRIASIYFDMDFAVSLIFILAAPDSPKFEIVVQIILLAIYLAALLINLSANNETVQSLQQQTEDRQYVVMCRERLKGLMDSTNDREMYKQLERAYDVLSSSQIKSSDNVREQELTVIRLISALEQEMAVSNMDSSVRIIGSIIRTAQERNRILKIR